jgi:hypothetical protein
VARSIDYPSVSGTAGAAFQNLEFSEIRRLALNSLCDDLNQILIGRLISHVVSIRVASFVSRAAPMSTPKTVAITLGTVQFECKLLAGREITTQTVQESREGVNLRMLDEDVPVPN